MKEKNYLTFQVGTILNTNVFLLFARYLNFIFIFGLLFKVHDI